MRAFWFVLASAVLIVNGDEKIKAKDCKTPVKPSLPAPAFKGDIHLSSEDCGLWEHSKRTEAPWMVWIGGPDANFHRCTAILISRTSLLSRGCIKEAEAFSEGNKTNWKAHLGSCFDEKHAEKFKRIPFTGNCTERSRGQVLELESVTKLDIPNSNGIHSWKIKSANFLKNWITPLCLFNKNNQQDSQSGQNYHTYSVNWWLHEPADIVANSSSCLKDDIFSSQCDRLKTSLCVRSTKRIDSYKFLLQRESDRLFFRGIHDFDGKEDKAAVFTDLLPFTEEIVNKSSGIEVVASPPKNNKN